MDTNDIPAIDLGRSNSVVCWYNPETQAAEYRTIHSTPEELRQALAQRPASAVVYEACSQAGCVHDLCEERGLPITFASTSGEAWQWKRVKKMTDRDDALKRARLEAMGAGQPPAGGGACGSSPFRPSAVPKTADSLAWKSHPPAPAAIHEHTQGDAHEPLTQYTRPPIPRADLNGGAPRARTRRFG